MFLRHKRRSIQNIFDVIPVEIVIHILHFCPRLSRLRLVCRIWRDVITDSPLLNCNIRSKIVRCHSDLEKLNEMKFPFSVQLYAVIPSWHHRKTLKFYSYSNPWHYPICHKDLYQLVDVPVVELCGCKNVSNVLALCNAVDVRLRNCLNLADVSPLKKAARLSISFCPVSDLSMLTSLKSLNLLHVSAVQSLSTMTQLTYLDVNGCRNLVELPHLSKDASVEIRSCDSLFDLSPLANVHMLYLWYQRKVDAAPLTALQRLIIGYCDHIINLHNCTQLLSLTMYYTRDNNTPKLPILSPTSELTMVVNNW